MYQKIMVAGKCSQVFIINPSGQTIRNFSSGKLSGGDFLCTTISPQGEQATSIQFQINNCLNIRCIPPGKWIYCVGEDGVLYMFESQSGQLENVLEVKNLLIGKMTLTSFISIIFR